MSDEDVPLEERFALPSEDPIATMRLSTTRTGEPQRSDRSSPLGGEHRADPNEHFRLNNGDLQPTTYRLGSGTEVKFGEHAPRLIVTKVLGPVTVEGFHEPPERSIVTELACFLALHKDRRFTGEQLRVALRPDPEQELADGTMRTYLSMLRKSLGPDIELRAEHSYQVGVFHSDWESFCSASGPECDTTSRMTALGLIRGRPFEDVGKGTYRWVFAELWISTMEVAIVETALAAARDVLQDGDLDGAGWALRQGLLGVPLDLSLWALFFEVAERQGSRALATARAQAEEALGADVVDSLLSGPVA